MPNRSELSRFTIAELNLWFKLMLFWYGLEEKFYLVDLEDQGEVWCIVVRLHCFGYS